jgi:hypothetical protein
VPRQLIGHALHQFEGDRFEVGAAERGEREDFVTDWLAHADQCRTASVQSLSH